nr:unnamed protein product [Callosobruchus chinensis]
MESFEIKAAHQRHVKSNRTVAAVFAGSHRVVSVSDDGHIIVWSFNNNEMVHITNMFSAKVTVTSMSICPHYPRLAAFGMKSELILVVSLGVTRKIVSQLRWHDEEVISMDWCPIPFNIFPKNPNNEAYITPEQLRAAGKEDTADLIQGLLDEILVSVSTHAESGTVSTSFYGPPSAGATQTPALEEQIPATVSETSRDVQISSSSLTRCSEKARSTESLSSDTQQVLDMAGTKQVTIKDSAAAQSAPQTSTEMTPGANVDKKKILNKGIPKLQDLVALSLFAKKPYCEECSKEECACVNTVKMITANVEQAREEFLVVSSARELALIIWRVGPMGNIQTTVRLPAAKKQKKGRYNDRLWITAST